MSRLPRASLAGLLASAALHAAVAAVLVSGHGEEAMAPPAIAVELVSLPAAGTIVAAAGPAMAASAAKQAAPADLPGRPAAVEAHPAPTQTDRPPPPATARAIARAIARAAEQLITRTGTIPPEPPAASREATEVAARPAPPRPLPRLPGTTGHRAPPPPRDEPPPTPPVRQAAITAPTAEPAATGPAASPRADTTTAALATAPAPAGAVRAGHETGGGGQGMAAAAPTPVAYGGNPRPAYPIAARRDGVEGRVLLRAEVSPDGSSGRVVILRSSGNSLLDEAALAAVRRWRFHPAEVAGHPVASSIDIPLVFRLR